MLYVCIRATRKVTDVHFVNDQFIYRSLQRKVILPIEIIANHTGTVLIRIIPVRLRSPHIASRNQLGIRVHQNLRLVKAMSFFRIPRAVHPITIFDILEIQIENHHREYIPHLELLLERYLHERFRLVIMEKDQRAGSGITGIDREVHGIPHYGSAKRIRAPRAQLQAFILVRRK